MYCKKCGKLNPEGSKFCQHCGIKFNEKLSETSSSSHVEKSSGRHVGAEDTPYPYVISIWKLVIMSLATFGFYEIYWFYKQWKSFNAENKLNHGRFALWMSALFAPLTSYSLFKHVSEDVKEVNKGQGLESGALAVVYFFVTRFWLGFLPLIPVQNKINLYWEKKYDDRLVRSNFGLWNWIVVIVVAIILYAIYAGDTSSSSTSTVTPEPTPVVQTYDQSKIVSSVVNILCPSIYGESESTGGSGTIITDDGVILTNAHIIPHNKRNTLVKDDGCIVTIPDPKTGQIVEIYYANPIVLPEISDNYDLAYLKIYKAVYDDKTGKTWGTYPKKFDALSCLDGKVDLGDSVRIFGYPAISGDGLSLTVTDGIVSSLPGDGTIVTSAKINHGNSGGLAVNSQGCMIGVPSAFTSDDAGSLGIIYSMDTINSFSSEVSDYLNK